VLALGVQYLCGWAIATHHGDRLAAEWPPHPDRIFMALVATHFATDGGRDERDALEWLERQPPPALTVSAAHSRQAVTAFVPVNDVAVPRVRKGRKLHELADWEAGLKLLPERRPRQPRQYPAVIPHDSRVFFQWETAVPSPAIRDTLAALCQKVTRVGHSASLVQMWVEDAPPPSTLRPSVQAATQRLRVPCEGRLSHLIEQFDRGLRPVSGTWQGYAPVEPTPAEPVVATSVFSPDLFVLRLERGTRLPLISALALTRAVRASAMAIAPEPLPEWLTGHREDGAPSTLPHLSFVPLADVDHKYADGHLLGIAFVVPRSIPADEMAQQLLVPLFRIATNPDGLHVFDGHAIEVTFSADVDEDCPAGLKARTWTAEASVDPMTRWATVTPVVLDRYPKRDGDADAAVAIACERIGLPRPIDVVTSPISILAGVPPAWQFPPWSAGGHRGKGDRVHTHAVLTFDRPVIGPVLIGAGRFRGYGVCRPLRPTFRSTR
jgi:CRISPR-associated protein Csb2